MPRYKYLRRVTATEGVREPYEQFLYIDLRDEVARRKLCRIGVGGASTKAAFIQALRKADATARAVAATNANAPGDQAPVQSAAPNLAASVNLPAAGKRGPSAAPTAREPPKSQRAVRPRRGCRVRLINVLLSPEFNTRWREMISRGSGGSLEVNAFWLDVHVAFNQQNSLFDALHFEDALFSHVDPSVILKHSAARLLQMWVEIIGMYRTAVRSAQQAPAAGSASPPFFDYCAGRLDLLYLHMALLLDAGLFEFVMGDAIPGSDTMPVAKIKIVDPMTGLVATKPAARKPPTGGKAKRKAWTQHATTNQSTAGKSIRKSQVSAATTFKATAAAQAFGLTAMPVQNPEMSESALASALAAAQRKKEPPKKTAKPAVGHTQERKSEAKPPAAKPRVNGVAAAQTNDPPPASSEPGAQTTVVPTISLQSSPPALAPRAMTNSPVAPQSPAADRRSPFGANTASLRSPLPARAPLASSKSPRTPRSQAAGKRSHVGGSEPASNGDGSASPDFDAPPRRRPAAKRAREPAETSTDIVAVPDSSARVESSTDLVPHKRFHATVSTTALTPARPSTELMLPPDEWDILEKRLRKTNENIDRCHRALTGLEANMSASYRQTLEADLRFFSAIKQRLQEQLLVVMQSGY